ncbi:MAG: hypothetical protein JWN72_677 [Thermoleophilia bacterium]|nr:hypothetical protein [Thermoleophilia bacterium]
MTSIYPMRAGIRPVRGVVVAPVDQSSLVDAAHADRALALDDARDGASLSIRPEGGWSSRHVERALKQAAGSVVQDAGEERKRLMEELRKKLRAAVASGHVPVDVILEMAGMGMLGEVGDIVRQGLSEHPAMAASVARELDGAAAVLGAMGIALPVAVPLAKQPRT